MRTIVVIVASIVLFGNCYEDPNRGEDLAKLHELRKLYPQYEFEFDNINYLKVRPIAGEIDRAAAVKIYRRFRFEGERDRRTPYTFMNVYSPTGEFLFQVLWNRETHKFAFTEHEYH